ncbi:MAG: hypothetical protein WBO09_14765 [Methylocystis silviterrae]|jgi:hypothetical protein
MPCANPWIGCAPINTADHGGRYRTESVSAKAAPLVKGSTQNNLYVDGFEGAYQRSVGRQFSQMLSKPRGSFNDSTFRLTGSGSSSLNIGRAFVLNVIGRSLR